ncbi:MAG TPA: sigma-70 family RNA polymerase sigma factor [Patescibacteria group bacterium]|nr:sigma-70 family RNA polymerase sigma factor [Patescibacteria group bacterium]
MVDERELIRRSRRKDQQAFEMLVGLKRALAFRIAFNIVGDEDDAKDVAQMSFIRLWSVIDSFDENSRFDPWFYRIVVNLAIDFYRNRQRGPRPVGSPESRGSSDSGGRSDHDDDVAAALPALAMPGADAEVMRAELRRVFNEIAVELAPAQRAVFSLKEIEGVATDDIAKIMGIKASTVRNHLLAARRVLQDGLRRRYPEYFRGSKK